MSFAAPSKQGQTERVWYPKGKKFPYHDGPKNDQLLSMVMALTAEVSILRERLDTNERVAEQHELYKQTEIETFDPDEGAMVERAGLRKRILHKVFRVLQEQPSAPDPPLHGADSEDGDAA